MTTVVILMMGFGAILIVSGLEATSVTQTISDVWNNKVSVASSSSSGGGGNSGGKSGPAGQPAPPNHAPPGTATREGWLASRADMTRYYIQHRYGLGG